MCGKSYSEEDISEVQELARIQEKKTFICHRHSSLCGEEGKNENFFNLFLAFFNVSLSLLQATNSHTNEVVAVKKMSYSGKQTNEVRGMKAAVHSGAVEM